MKHRILGKNKVWSKNRNLKGVIIMAKRYCSLFLVLLLVKSIYGQGTALPFLTIQQSPLLIGAGGIGAAIPMNDATGFYYNPAQLGNFARENNFSLFFMPQKTQWMPNLGRDLSFNSFGVSVGYNFKKHNNDLPLAIGVGYLNDKFSYGEFVRTGPDSPEPIGTYESYDKFDCISIGAGYGDLVRFNLGVSVKSYNSNFSDSPTEQEPGTGAADGTAFDFGAMLVTPISELLLKNHKINLAEETFLKPKIDFTLGYSILNIGKEISYADPAQKDPLPRTARIGYSLNFGLNIVCATWQMDAIDYSFTAEADDILVKRNPDNGSYEYDDIFGAISPVKHLIALKGDEAVVVHRGHILRLFETIIVTSGRFNTRTPAGMKSNGLGFSSEGIMKLYSAFADNPIISYAADHFVVEYYDVNSFADSFLETNFKGLVLNIKGIEL